MKLHFSFAQWMLDSPIYQKFYWLYCYCTFYVCNQARCFWHEGMVYHPNKEESNKFCHESLACKMGWYSARIRSTLPEALLDRCSFHFLVPCRTSAQLKIHDHSVKLSQTKIFNLTFELSLWPSNAFPAFPIDNSKYIGLSPSFLSIIVASIIVANRKNSSFLV